VSGRGETAVGQSEGFVSVDGVRLFYRERGNGVPVVLIHGTGANADCWGDCFDDLARDFRVIAYDRRSYSRSAHAPVNSVARHTADLVALLRLLDAAPAVLVGWSFGGPMSLRLAAASPEMVRSLVLVEPALPWWRCLEGGILRALTTARLTQMRGRPVDAVEAFERWAGGHRSGGISTFDSQPAAARQAQLDNTPGALGELGMLPWQAVSPRAVRAIRHEVTILVGDESPDWYHRVANAIEKLRPSIRSVAVPGAGHFVHIDAPSVFVEAVRVAAT
jgi:pimeloyl-ACP methyl ester carboxylesterase